ncbi:MAG: 1-deoxy-D-xylulose-5-phosphate reductoisomerase, partial [bacterium]|nr:1-deoxy-D-xylulose-5-phosphate reductoisomerase [bacterium]
ADDIQVVVHPQSIIHSMVEFCDSSVIAQLSNPDMRLPIAFALFWPDRTKSAYGRIDWTELKKITFEPPDFERFPALKLAFEVARTGGTAPAVYNAANEIAVEAFLNKEIKFTEIADTIRETVEKVTSVDRPELEDILEADRRARELARSTLEKTIC